MSEEFVVEVIVLVDRAVRLLPVAVKEELLMLTLTRDSCRTTGNVRNDTFGRLLLSGLLLSPNIYIFLKLACLPDEPAK